MATLDEFLPQVLPSVIGCPADVAKNAVLNACIRFCTDTWLIRETLTPFDSVVDQDVYPLSPAASTAVVGIVYLSYDDVELERITEEELDIVDFGWRTADPNVPTLVISPDEAGIIQFNRKPADAVTAGISVRIATKPTDDATDVDDKLFSEWREAIKYGALQELFEIPKKGWSDMKQALWYGKRFNFQIQRGKARAVMGHMRKSTTARARAWI